MATIEPNFESICINPNDDLVLYKKEIVRSRIEKFLYAICSLDTDDLPTPLSRIEELYNCLVTGEDIPTFTPLSRAEKFVMAMLGAYDVELLPTPISRSETLMKKIATGDNNLDDVDNLQSRYEFLLAYIIKAGGFNGGSPDDPSGSADFYYKLTSLTSSFTTIYDTFDIPVKNAVLRGQTLVNLASRREVNLSNTSTIETGFKFNATAGTSDLKMGFLNIAKPNTYYTYIFTSDTAFEYYTGWDATNSSGWNQPKHQAVVGLNVLRVKTEVNTTNTALLFRTKADLVGNKDVYLTNFMILEGDYTNVDIPYFEGMASIKMPVLTTVGKNLFEGEFKLSTYASGKATIPNGIISSVSFPHTTSSNRRGISCIIQVKPNTNYTISIVDKQTDTVLLGTGYNNLEDISSQAKSVMHTGSVDNTNHTTLSFTTPSNCNYMVIGCYINYAYEQSGGTITFNEPPKIQLEENSVSTPYEPYKSTTVSCNEEVELCEINGVKDELNLVTGELTERVGEITLDGSVDEGWSLLRKDTMTNVFQMPTSLNIKLRSDLLSNLFDGKYIETIQDGVEVIKFNNSKIYVNISNTKATTVEDFKNYIAQQPLTIQYQLATESIKTVDLSTLDQDGKETELSTFDDITHVIVSSEGLVPTGEIVTTKPIHFVNYPINSSVTTLYNTVEYPVKNAVLKGSTLVNLVGTYKHTISTVNKPIAWGQKRLFLTNIKPNTRYTLRVKMTEVVKGNYGPRVQIFFTTYSTGEVNTTTSTSDTLIFTSPAELSSDAHLRLIVTGSEAEATEVDFEILLLEGEHPDIKDIPFVDDMASIKMPTLTTTGKNLFDINKFAGVGIDEQGYYFPTRFIDNGAYTTLQLKPNTNYVVKGTYIYNGTSSFVYRVEHDGSYRNLNITFNTDATGITNIKIGSNNYDVSNPSKVENIMIVESTLKDIYEPYKSTTVSCNEEVELCRIGDMRDELNLVTGELIQRIGTYTFTGDEPFKIVGTPSYFEINLAYIPVKPSTNINAPILCNRLPTINYKEFTTDNEGINLTYTIRLNFKNCHASQGATVEDLKAYLKANPTTICYPLVEVVKTVDLSIVDQDGNETELSTFDNITHVLTSSEELAPTGEIDIARPIQFVDYSLDNSLTTLYNTFDFPVKNAVLRGQTLVNLASLTGVTTLKPGDVVFIENTGMKMNTTYTIMFNCSKVPSTNFVEVRTMMDNTQITQVQQNISTGYNKFTIKTNTSKGANRFRFKNDTSATTDFIFSELVILEGDYTNIDIPYFEGIQSVKMPVLTMSNEDDTKSNILTCNEEVELRGIGDIKDELNLMTGVYTKAVYEYTFTGDEIWRLVSGSNGGTGYSYFACNLTGSMIKYNYKSDANVPIVCNRLPVVTYLDFDNGLKNVGINLTYFFRLNFSDCDSNNGATIEDLKAYLKANPTTVQYPISKSVETVDLSVVDQAGNVLLITENGEYMITENGDYIKVGTKYKEKETGLSTFDDITHVTVSSEGLIPTGEITVATKDATDVIEASVMSLRMDDILNSQSTLEGSANAQSDDIDVTMLGTTDIYEQLL